MSHAGGPNYASLVTMANQISQFFESQAGTDPAVAIADHIRKFWDPRMRSHIVQYTRDGGEGLREPAARAVALIEAPA